jgi:hypothetical protein
MLYATKVMLLQAMIHHTSLLHIYKPKLLRKQIISKCDLHAALLLCGSPISPQCVHDISAFCFTQANVRYLVCSQHLHRFSWSQYLVLTLELVYVISCAAERGRIGSWDEWQRQQYQQLNSISRISSWAALAEQRQQQQQQQQQLCVCS